MSHVPQQGDSEFVTRSEFRKALDETREEMTARLDNFQKLITGWRTEDKTLQKAVGDRERSRESKLDMLLQKQDERDRQEAVKTAIRASEEARRDKWLRGTYVMAKWIGVLTGGLFAHLIARLFHITI
jgi:hypothetical protein